MNRPETKSILVLFYEGGTKIQFNTPYTPKELNSKIDQTVETFEIESIPQDENVLTEVAYPRITGLIMHVIVTPRPKTFSNILSINK